jgi:hypothetical protein
MSRRKKSRRQRAAASQQRRQHIGREPTRLLRLLPRLGDTIDSPLLAQFWVSVLVRGEWAALNAALQHLAKPDSGSEALNTLDTLVEAGAPILAQRVLKEHIRRHRAIYSHWHLQAISFHPPSPECSASTIWGELSGDVAPAVEMSLVIATQARSIVPDLPDDIFWPFIGAFFCAIDSSPQVSPGTWVELEKIPEQFSLLNILITAHYGAPSKVQYASEIVMSQDTLGWRLCFRCGRASKSEEYILWDDRQFCPYWCGGQLGWDSEEWSQVRTTNPSLPRDPQKWTVYSEFSDDPAHMVDYGGP